jgi:hypothetical protein
MSDPRDEVCSVCGSGGLESFFEVSGIPVLVCVLWPDEASARDCPKGDIRLTFCPTCGLIENRDYDPAIVEYSENYENSLHFSEFFQGYIRGFAEDISRRHDLAGKRVIEVGSGDGEFVSLLCELGADEGIGFDPSYPPDRPDTLLDGRVRFVRDYYTAEHAAVQGDLIVCRQVLEHIPAPRAFMEGIRDSLGDRVETAIVFEVPNMMFTLSQRSLWDVIYEHVTYFSRGTLARLFSSTGFDVIDTSETYARQFIAVDAQPTHDAVGTIRTDVDDLDELASEVGAFSAAYRARITDWHERLSGARADGRRVALWGTGARGVNFLNLADPDGVIEHVVDINPRKHGMHVAGTGQRIARPGELVAVDPDEVIVMNPVYLEEITTSLHDMGLHPAVVPA